MPKRPTLPPVNDAPHTLAVRRLLEWAGSSQNLVRVVSLTDRTSPTHWARRGLPRPAAYLLHIYGIMPLTLVYPEIPVPERVRWVIADLNMPYVGAQLKGLPPAVVQHVTDPFAA